jgi:hypothetical protein
VYDTLAPQMTAMVQDAFAVVMKRTSTAVEDATKSLLARYRFEVHQRKILYNKLQELKGLFGFSCLFVNVFCPTVIVHQYVFQVGFAIQFIIHEFDPDAFHSSFSSK